jgi:hypothetical protein
MTERTSSRPDNFQEISEFIKNEKKNNKKAKNKMSLLTESITIDSSGTLKSKKKNTEKEDKIENYYRIYSEELECHIEELLKRNEQLENKIQSSQNLEKENISLKIESLKYKKFKKLAYAFRKEQTEANLTKKSQSLKCENPFCVANLVSIIELQKEYDKILIENIKLKRENFLLKQNANN